MSGREAVPCLIAIILSLVTGFAWADPVPLHPKICVYSSAYYKISGSALRSQTLQRSHDMAFEDESFRQFKMLSAKDEVELVSELETAAAQGCRVIVGLHTSRECLIGGPTAKKHGMTIVSPTCAHDEVSKFSPHIFVGAGSIQDFSMAVANQVERMVSNRISENVLVISQAGDVFSKKSLETLQSKISPSIPLKIFVANRAGELPAKQLKEIRDLKGSRAFVFVTYPLIAASVLGQLEANGEKFERDSLVGSSSWTFDLSLLKIRASAIASFKNAWMPEPFRAEDFEKSEFSRKYKQKFGETPLGFHVISYDLTRMAIQCFRKSELIRDFDREFQKCMTAGAHAGVAGALRFLPGQVFARRDIRLAEMRSRLMP